MRTSGPFTAVEQDGSVAGRDLRSHSPVVVWYSPDILARLKKNRATPALRRAPAPLLSNNGRV
jgi:hypothetical protein